MKMIKHLLPIVLACAPGTVSAVENTAAAELNFYTQSAEEICAADWHSQYAKQEALTAMAFIRIMPPGQNLTEDDCVKLAQILARESKPGCTVSPIFPLLLYSEMQTTNASPQAKLQWLESHLKPYLDTDDGAAHIWIAGIAAKCGQDIMPRLKASAEARQLQGLLGYGSQFCKVKRNNADEMQKYLTAAAPKLVDLGVKPCLRANMLMNMAESCEMKGGAFDALRGPCLVWAFCVNNKGSEYAYLLPSYYENWEAPYWKVSAFKHYERLCSTTTPSPLVFKRAAHLLEQMGITEHVEELNQMAVKAGYQEGTDYLHDFPHGEAVYTNPQQNPSLAIDENDQKLFCSGIQNAARSRQKALNGADDIVITMISDYFNVMNSSESSLQKLERLKEQLKGKVTDQNVGDIYFSIYEIYQKLGDRIKSSDYLMKSADMGNGKALCELAKLAGPTSDEYSDLIAQATMAGSGEAAFLMFEFARKYPERVNGPAGAAIRSMGMALAENYAPACDYAEKAEKDNPSAVLLLRAMAAANCGDRIPALDTALADYAKAHPETQAVVRAIRTAILSSVEAQQFEHEEQARRTLDTLSSLLQEYGLPAEEIQARTEALKNGIDEHFKK